VARRLHRHQRSYVGPIARGSEGSHQGA